MCSASCGTTGGVGITRSDRRPGGFPPGAGWPVLGAIVALGLALRLFRLGHQSLWLDEVLSVQSASLPVFQILFDPAVDRNFPPLHNLLVHPMIRAFGASEAAVRLPSVLAGVAGIPLAYGVARCWLGTGAGLMSALLLALSPLHVWYSQEARPYALFVALGLASLRFAQQVRARPAALGTQAGLVLCATALLYTHVLALPFLAFLALYGLAGPGWPERGRWVLLIGLVALLGGPQLYEFFQTPPTVSGNPDYRFNPVHLGYTFWAFAAGFSIGPSLLELRRGMPAVLEHLPLMVPALGLLAGLSTLGVWELWRRHRATLGWIAGWVAFPMAFAVLGAVLSDHPYNVRYVLLALPAFLMVLAAAVTGRAPVSLRLVGAGLLAGLFAASLAGHYADPRYQREDNRGAAAYLNANVAPEDLVLVSAPYTLLALEHYGLRPELVVRTYPPGGHLVDASRVDRDLRRLCRTGDRIWLSLSRTFHSDPDGSIRRFFDRRLEPIGEYRGAGVLVLGYRSPPGGECGSPANHPQDESGVDRAH